MRLATMARGVVMVLILFASASVHAGLEPRWGVAFAADGSVCHGYHLWLVAGALQPGAPVSQHVTFYDVQNLLSPPPPPPGWTVSVQARGVDANEVAMRGRDDSNRVSNVTWTWIGTTRVEAPAEVAFIIVCSAGPAGSGVTGPYRYVSQTSGPLGPTALVGSVTGTRYP